MEAPPGAQWAAPILSARYARDTPTMEAATIEAPTRQPADGSYDSSIPPMLSHSEFGGLMTINGISILCSLFVVSFILMYRSTISSVAARRRVGRRRKGSMLMPLGTQASMYLSMPASLRLLFFASIIDVLYSCFRIYNLAIAKPGFAGSHYANCRAAMWGVAFCNLMSVFVRALLSVHLHLVILNNVRHVMAYEKHFLVVSLGLAIVLSLLPVFTKNYVWVNFDPTIGSGHCSYFLLNYNSNSSSSSSRWGREASAEAVRAAMQKGLIIMWATNFAWLLLTVLYGLFVIVSVCIKLAKQRSDIDKATRHRSIVVRRHNDRREFWMMTAKVARRILQFPLMVVVCHVFEVVYAFATLSKSLSLISDSGKIAKSSANSGSESVVSVDASAGRNHGLVQVYMTSQIMLAMEGIITLMFLPLEPPIRLMLRSFFLRRRRALHRIGGSLRLSSPRPAAGSSQTLQAQSARANRTDKSRRHESSMVLLHAAHSTQLPPSEHGSESQRNSLLIVPCAPTMPRSPSGLISSSSMYYYPTLPDDPLEVVPHRPHVQCTCAHASGSSCCCCLDSSPHGNASGRKVATPAPARVKGKGVSGDDDDAPWNNLPWDVVFRHEQPGLAKTDMTRIGKRRVISVADDTYTNGVLALRNDGLPAQQWYVPAADPRERTELAEEAPISQSHSSSGRTLCSVDEREH